MSQTYQNDPDVELATPLALVHMLSTIWISQAIYTIAKLGLADLLKDGPRTAEELAIATGTHCASLRRLLDALTKIHLFLKDAHQRFHLTPLTSYLQTDVPYSLRSLAIMMGETWYQQPWSHLLYSVQTGEEAFRHVFAMSAFEYFQQHPEASNVFDAAMSNLAQQRYASISKIYDFSDSKLVIDVGGGQGTLMRYLLEANPGLKGIIVDQHHVLGTAKETMVSAGLEDRCEVVAGDFFTAVPLGGDIYILSKIIHDWEDEQALQILRTCRNAISQNSVLLLIEIVLQADDESWDESWYERFVDIEMLIMVGGCERTEAEYRSLLVRAGFDIVRLIPTSASLSIIEARPVDRDAQRDASCDF